MGISQASALAAVNHVFPPGTPCLFCSTVPPAPAAPGCNDAQEMWRLTDPNQYSRSFTCEGFHLPVPRCARCKAVHDRGKKWALVAWACGAVLLVPAIGLAGGNWIMAAMVGLIVPIFPAGFIINRLSKAPGTQTFANEKLLESYPPAARYLQEGWGITQYHAKANRQRHPSWRPE